MPSAGLWGDAALEPLFGDLWTYVSTDVQSHRYNNVRSARSVNSNDEVRAGLFLGEISPQPLFFPPDIADVPSPGVPALMTPRRGDQRTWERRTSGSTSPPPSRPLPSTFDSAGAAMGSGALRAPSPNRALIRSDLARARDSTTTVVQALATIAPDYIDTDGNLSQLAVPARVQNRQGF